MKDLTVTLKLIENSYSISANKLCGRIHLKTLYCKHYFCRKWITACFPLFEGLNLPQT